MKVRTHSKLIAVCIALIMVLTSGTAVFATSSPSGGGKVAKVTKVTTDADYQKKIIKISYKAKNAVKYKIAYRVKGGKWKYITTKNKNYTLKKLKAGKKYQIKVAGINKKGKVGKYFKIQYRWFKNTKYKLTAKKKAFKVKINKVKGAKKYQITYSLKSNFSGAKVVYTTSLTKTIKNLKKGKTYYVRIRPVSGKYKGITVKKKIKVK